MSYKITAKEDAQELGYINYSFNRRFFFDSIYNIDFISVKPEHRGKKLGPQLFGLALKDIQSKGGTRLEWKVFPSGDEPTSHEGLVEFYKKLGGIISKEENYPRITYMYVNIPSAQKTVGYGASFALLSALGYLIYIKSKTP